MTLTPMMSDAFAMLSIALLCSDLRYVEKLNITAIQKISHVALEGSTGPAKICREYQPANHSEAHTVPNAANIRTKIRQYADQSAAPRAQIAASFRTFPRPLSRLLSGKLFPLRLPYERHQRDEHPCHLERHHRPCLLRVGVHAQPERAEEIHRLEPAIP